MVIDNRRAAKALLDVISGLPVNDGRVEDVRAYFSGQGVPVSPAIFREWLTRVQEDLDNQPELLRLAEQWRETLARRKGFTREQAEQFHRQYASVLDTSGIMKEPVVIGFADRKAGSLFDLEISQPRKTTGWILLYTVTGEADLKAGLREITVAPGDALLMSPNSVYTLRRRRRSRRWAHYWINFQPHTDWRPHLDWPTAAPHIGYIRIPDSHRKQFDGLMEQLLENGGNDSPMKFELEANMLEQLLLRCRNLFANIHHRVTDERIERAKRYIEEHYSEPFRLEDVAGAAHMSPSRLSALFKQHAGISALGWRDERRLIQAARLLRSTDLPVADIGASVGFADATYFSRTFRRYVGYSPRQYRQRQQLNLIESGK